MTAMPDGTERIPVALVGCGSVAHYHARHLLASPRVELKAVVDTDPAAARSFGDRYGIDTVCSTLTEALSRCHLQGVHIATPPDSHEELTRQALSQKVHVIVEKPVADSIAAISDLYRLADEKGVLLVPDFSLYYHEGMIRAREWIAAGRIGTVIGVHCLYYAELSRDRLQEPETPPWIFNLPAGVLHNYISHPLSLVLGLVGSVTGLDIRARSLGYLPQGLTDHLDVLVETDTANAYLCVSLAARPPQIALTIQGDRGRIFLDLDSFQIRLETGGGRMESIRRLLGPAVSGMSGIRQVTGNAVRIARRRLVPYQGLKVLIDRFYESAVHGGSEPIPRDLVLAVAQVEERVIRSPGIWHLSYPHASHTTPTATRSKSIAVTGASGYLGRRVVQRLVSHGYTVRALVRWQSRCRHLMQSGVELIYGDIRDSEAIRRLVAGTEGIIHVAAGVRGSREFIIDSCVEGTRHVLHAVREAGLARNIYISSMAVFDYLALGKGVLNEDAPLESRPDQRSAYAEGKTLAEKLVAGEQADGGVPWIIIRPAALFGGEDITRHFGPRIGRRVFILGSPRQNLRLVHVEDTADAVVSLLSRSDFPGGTDLNLSHPDAVPMREAAALFRNERGLRVWYLRPFIGKGLSVLTRLTHALSGRGPRISRRQAAYLFTTCRIDPTRALQSDWRPRADLLAQLEETVKG